MLAKIFTTLQENFSRAMPIESIAVSKEASLLAALHGFLLWPGAQDPATEQEKTDVPLGLHP